METMPAFIASTVFVGVIILIMTETLHLTIAGFLGALIIIFCHIITLQEAANYISQSYATIALFFGVMVLVRAFEPTKVFEYIATKMVIFAKGDGKKLLLGIVAITVPICAILPNATTIMLLGPLIPPIAEEIGVDFVPLLILMILVANSAGLLTLVGDPATFIVGDAINITFIEYLQQLSIGGIISVITIVVMIPILFRKTWNTKLTDLKTLPHPQINHPRMVILGGFITIFMLTFFIIGDSLPIPVSPAAVALLGAALAMLLSHHSHIDSVNNILKDVDWSTLLFFMSIFVLIGGLDKTGVFAYLSNLLTLIIGKNIVFGTIILLFLTGILSSVVPNIPLLVGVIPLLKQYLVNASLADSAVLDPNFSGSFSPEVLPLFYAMMFGASLGGNGTLVGGSANIVGAGISELHGKSISFKKFLKYGIPVMAAQLITSAMFIGFRFLI
jgi:Na+/H+ antiporter NhaD/arsenite permease-like protein